MALVDDSENGFDVNGAYYEVFRGLVPALPPLSEDWSIRTRLQIAAMGAHVGYMAAIRQMLAKDGIQAANGFEPETIVASLG